MTDNQIIVIMQVSVVNGGFMKKERAYREIDLERLIHNYNCFKTYLDPLTKFMAVVKADAYGHGAIEISKTLESVGVTDFAVATYEEARSLRRSGITGNILIFGRTDPSHALKLDKYHLTQTITHLNYAIELNKHEIDIDAHIILDTGMTRFGIYTHFETDIEKSVSEVKAIIALKHIHVLGIYTHFSDADNLSSDFTNKQFSLFMKVIERLESEGIHIPLKHVANSSATLRFKEMHLSMVRVGIALYGYPQIKTDLDLLPVLSLYAQIVDIHETLPEDTVSYTRSFKSAGKRKIATVSIGYADGYLRASTNNDYFVYHNQLLPQVGNVCMDLTMIDITGTSLEIGDFLEVIGKNKTATVIAKNTLTIEYEVLTNISSRVPYFYLKKR